MSGTSLIVPGPAPRNETAKQTLERFQRAKAARDQFGGLIDTCYEYAIPLKQRGYMGGKLPDVDRLFDSTAVTAVQGLASETLDDVWPADQTPFELQAGPGIEEARREEVNRQLSAVASMIIQAINNSNFRSAGHEMLLDYCVGTGVMIIEEGDALRPINFRAIPLTQCVLDTGPNGDLDALFMPRKPQAQHIPRLWPKAALPPSLQTMIRENPSTEVEVVEAVERDWTARNQEVWVQQVLLKGNSDAGVLLEERFTGVGSCPFIAPSFSRVAGEAMGRGPVMMALPDIRTLNALKELMLEQLDLAISGVWLYDDNGVINPDTAILEPGALIPRVPGSEGLKNLVPSADMNASWNQIEELRAAIKEALYVNDLGDINKTPKTATEIARRTADRARRLSGAYGRLLTEFLFPMVARVWWLMKRGNGWGELPPIDGDRIMIRPLSPITRAQAQDDVLRVESYLQMLNGYFGPQAALLTMDTDALAKYLARKVGVDATLLRPEAEKGALMQQIATMAQSAGMVPGAGAPA